MNELTVLYVQEGFYGTATFNLSRASVVDKVAKFAAKTVGGSSYTQLKSGLADTKTDHATRISFKVIAFVKHDDVRSSLITVFNLQINRVR